MQRAETLIILACCVTVICTLKVEAAPVMTKADVTRYLSEYGYLPQTVDGWSEGSIPEEEMSKAISSFQSFSGLTVTGKMNVETANRMSLRRCGNRDVRPEIQKSEPIHRYD